MATLTVPWCGDSLRIALPNRWILQQTAESEFKPASEDWPDRLAVSLHHPGTGPELSRLLEARRDASIVIVVEDVTRRGPLAKVLEIIMRELRFARIGNEQIEVFFATGMHPPMHIEQVAEKLGLAGEGIRWRCNCCHDASRYVSVGRIGKLNVLLDRDVAKADLRIIVSSVSPHFQAGFGGGYRLLVPGSAHIRTIRELNRLGMDRANRQLVGSEADANPMRSMIDAAGVLADQRSGKSFAVQYLLDNNAEPTSIAAGEIIPTQRMVAKQCSVACGVVLNSVGDVVISNAYPCEFDLSQSLKSIVNTRWAVRPGGVILGLTSTNIALRDLSVPRWPLSARWTRRMVRLIGPEAVCSLARRIIPNLAEDASPYFRLGAEVLYRNPIVLYAPNLHAQGVNLPGIELVGTLEDALRAVEREIPNGTLRTVAFPSGGTTFPILSPVVGQHHNGG